MSTVRLYTRNVTTLTLTNKYLVKTSHLFFSKYDTARDFSTTLPKFMANIYKNIKAKTL